MTREQVRREITKIYLKELGRYPDKNGLEFWTNNVMTGKLSINGVVREIRKSEEYRRRNANRITNEITKIYKKELGRYPDKEGLNFYLNKVLKGEMTLDDVVKSMRQSEEYKRKHSTKQIVLSKLKHTIISNQIPKTQVIFKSTPKTENIEEFSNYYKSYIMQLKKREPTYILSPRVAEPEKTEPTPLPKAETKITPETGIKITKQQMIELAKIGIPVAVLLILLSRRR